MHVTDFEWTDEIAEHIARHGVDPEEVEEVCFSNTCCVEIGRGGLYYATGQSASGRYLVVVLRYLGRGKVRVVTARGMSDEEKSRYRRKKGS